jgi:hypothetical protein
MIRKPCKEQKKSRAFVTDRYELIRSQIVESSLSLIPHLLSKTIFSYTDWQKCAGISSIDTWIFANKAVDFGQLARVFCTFAKELLDFRHWRVSYWRKSYWRDSETPKYFVKILKNWRIIKFPRWYICVPS